MHRFIAGLLVWMALCCSAQAQFAPPGFPPGTFQSRAALDAAPAPSFTGIGDVVSSATAWYGLRAYNASYASSTGKAANIRRASDNVQCDFDVTTAGGFGLTTATCNSSTQGGVSYATFVGTDAASSCTTSSFAATCLGTTGTIHVNDVVTSVGLTQPCIVTATNGSTTANIGIGSSGVGCGNVGVAETFTFQVAGWITKLYDQSGANFCSGAPCDISQATTADQLQFLPSCANSATLPCWLITSAGTLVGTNVAPANATMTFATVANRFNGTQSVQWLNFGAGGNHNNIRGTASTGNSWQLIPGGSGGFAATANDNTWHSAIGVMNGGSSVLNIDGTETIGSATGSTSSGPLSIVGGGVVGAYQSEVGVWGSTLFTGTQRTNACGNMATYYNTTIGANC